MVNPALGTDAQELPPDIVYHYTTAAGFLGIIQSGKLWASDIFYLNDSAEVMYARRAIETFIKRRFPDGDVHIGLQDYKTVRELLLGGPAAWGTAADAFVACFSADSDSLSQWRGYGAGTNGFALGFDRRLLSTSSQQEGTTDASVAMPSPTLHRVLYSETEQQRKLDTVYDEAVRDKGIDFTSLPDTLAPDDEANLLYLTASMAFAAVSLKSEAFTEEREWRLVTFATRSLPRRNWRFRVTGLGLTPYIELPVLDADSLAGSLREVRVGPTGYSSLAVQVIPSTVTLR